METIKELKEAMTLINELKSMIGNKDVFPTDSICEYVGRYVIIRTYSAGVHAGILKSKKGNEVVLTDSRRIWYWSGAASLSQLAKDGTSNPDDCKFPESIDEILLTEAIEIIPCTEESEKSIRGVKIWKE